MLHEPHRGLGLENVPDCAVAQDWHGNATDRRGFRDFDRVIDDLPAQGFGPQSTRQRRARLGRYAFPYDGAVWRQDQERTRHFPQFPVLLAVRAARFGEGWLMGRV